MRSEATVDHEQMASPFCFFKKPLSWAAAALVLSLVFAAFVGFGFLSVVLTSMLVIISTVLFTFTKQELVAPVKKSVTENVLESDHEQDVSSSSRIDDVASMKETECEVLTLLKNEQEEETLVEHQIHDYAARSPDLLSESESLNHLYSTSEDSEVDWPFRDIVYQSPDCSDGSISDEESLIEISLPSGHYVGNKDQEVPKFNLQQKLPDHFEPHSILKQQSLMELLAEINDMNEEDNLIEIDISMGSIKCSRFEIEA